jgi:hypothetical protein
VEAERLMEEKVACLSIVTLPADRCKYVCNPQAAIFSGILKISSE